MELHQMLVVALAYGAQVQIASESLAEQELSGIAYDSRKVKPGYLFVAIPGQLTDGHKYIDQAVAQGAIAIVAEQQPANLAEHVALILTKDSRRLLGQLVATYYGHPEQELRIIGVTGTNGKTTTTHLLKYLLESSGRKTGLVGTINNKAGSKVLPSTHTTPESLELFELFAMMRAEGCTDVVMEVSSHALAQGRTSACNFAGAIFTNLSQDHLDYHGSLEEYKRCKTLLFSGLESSPQAHKYAIINIDDPASAAFIEASDVPVYTYGEAVSASLRLLHYDTSVGGSSFTVSYQDRQYEVSVPLIGKFNIYNTLAVLACAVAEGINLDTACAMIAQAPQVPGRFELIEAGQSFSCVVDYAHTPDGLQNLLAAAQELKPRRIITVFGCGGNRDSGKRPIMGRIAGSMSDVAIVSTDNPRLEDPLAIIKQIEIGISEVATNYLVEPSRAKAIQLAVNMAEEGDMVVIAGKGHEDYQIIGNERQHFDDREEARQAIRARLSR